MRYFCENESVPADGADHAFTLGTGAGIERYRQGHLAVDLDVGAGTEDVTLALQARYPDDGEWFDVYAVDLTDNGAITNEQQYTADITAVITRVREFHRYLRLVVTNAGDNAATLTAIFDS